MTVPILDLDLLDVRSRWLAPMDAALSTSAAARETAGVRVATGHSAMALGTGEGAQARGHPIGQPELTPAGGCQGLVAA